MRAVRCDACGAKAMIAAAKCPSCSHLFELRDGFGELLPLAYCSSCESYYPESVGSCRWCGTKPDRPPIGPGVWRGAGAGLVAVIAVIAVLRNGAPQHTSREPVKAVEPPVSASAPLDSDTTTARLVVAATDSLLRTTTVADNASPDSVGRDSVGRAPNTVGRD